MTVLDTTNFHSRKLLIMRTVVKLNFLETKSVRFHDIAS